MFCSCVFVLHCLQQVQRPAEEPKLRADVANLKAFALRFREVLPADYYPVRSIDLRLERGVAGQPSP